MGSRHIAGFRSDGASWHAEVDRVMKSYGRSVERLIKAKRCYDPDNVFRCAIPLPVGRVMAGAA